LQLDARNFADFKAVRGPSSSMPKQLCRNSFSKNNVKACNERKMRHWRSKR